MAYQPIRTTGGMVPAKPKPKPLPQQNQMQVTGGQGLTTRGQPLTRGTATAPLTRPMNSPAPPVTRAGSITSGKLPPNTQQYAQQYALRSGMGATQATAPTRTAPLMQQGQNGMQYDPLRGQEAVRGGQGRYQEAVAPSYTDRYQTAVQDGGGFAGGSGGGFVERYNAALSGQGAGNGQPPSDPEMDFQAMYPDPSQHPEGIAGYLRDRSYARQKKQALAGMNQSQAGYATQYGAGPGQPGIGSPMVQQPLNSGGGGWGPGSAQRFDMYGRPILT